MISTRSKKYKKLGIIKDGIQIQLNDNLLQKESEFYSPIRFKQSVKKGESQLEALEKNGVKYIEVRILDLNPFQKTGIGKNELYFLHLFLIFCLFEDNDPITPLELSSINNNHHIVALLGRKNKLILEKHGIGAISLQDWGFEILNKIKLISELLDNNTGEYKYSDSVEDEYKKLLNIDLLPSSVIQKEMKDNNEDHIQFGLRWAKNGGNYDK